MQELHLTKAAKRAQITKLHLVSAKLKMLTEEAKRASKRMFILVNKLQAE